MSTNPDPRDLVRRQFGAHAQNYVSSPDHSKGDSLDRRSNHSCSPMCK